jgi:hypothetical protein
MKIVAREYYRKGSLLPFVSWRADSVTTFGDHQVEFDFPGGRVVRLMDGDSDVIALIHQGWKGARLSEFFGTVESDDFVVTKRKQDWSSSLSGNVMFEVTLKACGLSVTNMVMRFDLYNSFTVADVLQLKLFQDDRDQQSRLKIEGTCAEEHYDLAEVLACLLLHHSEEQGPSS